MVDIKADTINSEKKSQEKNIASELNPDQKGFLKKIIESAPKFTTEDDGKLGEFISLYFLSEALLRRICIYSARNQGKKKVGKRINVELDYNWSNFLLPDLCKQQFGIVFGSSDKRNLKSCKSLRNGLVHNLMKNDCKEINERFEILKKAMLYWIEMIKDNVE